MSTDRLELYRCRPSEGLRVPMLVHQSYIGYGTPTEAEVETAVNGRKGIISGGPLGMRVEDFKGWIREATRKR